jgi:hypothetical protein
LARTDLGVIAPDEDAASELGSAGQTIDPGDRMLEARVRFGGQLEEGVQRVIALGFGLDQGGTDAPQAYLGPGDESGQAESADRGAIELGMRLG